MANPKAELPVSTNLVRLARHLHVKDSKTVKQWLDSPVVQTGFQEFLAAYVIPVKNANRNVLPKGPELSMVVTALTQGQRKRHRYSFPKAADKETWQPVDHYARLLWYLCEDNSTEPGGIFYNDPISIHEKRRRMWPAIQRLVHAISSSRKNVSLNVPSSKGTSSNAQPQPRTPPAPDEEEEEEDNNETPEQPVWDLGNIDEAAFEEMRNQQTDDHTCAGARYDMVQQILAPWRQLPNEDIVHEANTALSNDAINHMNAETILHLEQGRNDDLEDDGASTVAVDEENDNPFEDSLVKI